ncbi:spermatogenesis associated 6-like protein isoform X2 [Cavia porcellus]|uniref:Spermatosis associated 6 like n=1 Tax=Cavia porcellus TaxID=10141 RepID=H0VMK4_CAVPO|nr:spermatogenesis associated 6-like protein isoform X2 [Cavia porcellus]
MPLEVVVELQIRAVSCPGVFLPHKQDVYLGVYLLNQYVETDCFPSVFPVVIQQSMRFEKVFENAIDPGAVSDLLEMWEELAYYEDNTRDFLFPEPKLTPSCPGIHREVLMKTTRDFPGIAPKLEFSTRTAIRECMFPYGKRLLEETYKSRRPFSASYRPAFSVNNRKMKLKDVNPDKPPKGTQSQAPSPRCTRHFSLDQPAESNLGNNFKYPAERRPPFVVRHVDSAKPFGEPHPQKSKRKSKFSNFPFSMRRASSLGSLAANVKVIREPDERIILRKASPSPLDSSKFGKSLPCDQGDADFHRETSFANCQHSKSPSPLDQPLLRERCYVSSESTWKKIQEREESNSEETYILERPNHPLKKYPQHEEGYF